MKTPGWFRRGAATTAVFALLGPFIAGLLVACLFLLGRSLPTTQPEPPGVIPILLAGLFGGFLVQLGPGLVTGLGMSFASPHIPTFRGWLGWTVLSATMLSAGVLALILQLSSATTELAPAIIMMVVLTIPGMLGGLVSAAATFRLRPRPSVKPTADVFA